MVRPQPSKLMIRVRFPSPAPRIPPSGRTALPAQEPGGAVFVNPQCGPGVGTMDRWRARGPLHRVLCRPGLGAGDRAQPAWPTVYERLPAGHAAGQRALPIAGACSFKGGLAAVRSVPDRIALPPPRAGRHGRDLRPRRGRRPSLAGGDRRQRRRAGADRPRRRHLGAAGLHLRRARRFAAADAGRSFCLIFKAVWNFLLESTRRPPFQLGTLRRRARRPPIEGTGQGAPARRPLPSERAVGEIEVAGVLRRDPLRADDEAARDGRRGHEPERGQLDGG